MACGWLGGCREGNYLLGESPLHSEAEYSPSTGTEASHCSQWSHGSPTAILIRVGAQLVSSDLHFISPIRSIRSFSSIQNSTRLSMHFIIYIEHDGYEKWTLFICHFDKIWRIDFVTETFFFFCFRTQFVSFSLWFYDDAFKQALSWKLSLTKYLYETIPSLPVVSRDLVRDSHTHDLDWRLHRKSCNLCVTCALIVRSRNVFKKVR